MSQKWPSIRLYREKLLTTISRSELDQIKVGLSVLGFKPSMADQLNDSASQASTSQHRQHRQHQPAPASTSPEGDTRIAGGVNRRLAVATKTARRAAQFHCCQRIVVFESLKFEL
ncbi:MAG: hypothetical protein ABJZ55_15165, partial [Fuerstiella sp.]